MEDKQKKTAFSKFDSSKANWFLKPENASELSNFSSSRHRLNYLDSNILEGTSDTENETEPLKVEYKIQDKEKTLKTINQKIQMYDKVGNQQELFNQRVKKQRVEKELKDLYKEYNEKDIPKKTKDIITGSIIPVQRRMPIINAIKKFIKRYILAKISRKFKALVVLGDSLDSLAVINKNVDELLNMQTPYGEDKQNYQKLTEYLYRAHKIRSQINKSIKRPA